MSRQGAPRSGKAKAETHGIESHADAEKIAAQGVADGIRRKHAAFLALACGTGLGLAFAGASLLWTPRIQVVEMEKQVIVKEPFEVEKQVILKEPVIVKETVIVKEAMPVPVHGQPQVAGNPPPSAGGGTTDEAKPDSPVPPANEGERRFTEQPSGYADATIRGRVVKSDDGTLKFDTGKVFFVADHAGNRPNDWYIDSEPYVGDFGYCSPMGKFYECYAYHNGTIVVIPNKRRPQTSTPSPTPAPRPLTPGEVTFTQSPGFQKTPFHGRIISSPDHGVHFDNGQRFYANGISGSPESEGFVGDFGFCDNAEPYNCFAYRDGKTVKIPVRSSGAYGWGALPTLPPRDPTPAEDQFIQSPGYQKTNIHGRFLKSPDGFARFDNGTLLSPASNDGRVRSFLTEEFVGDFGFCDNGAPFNCFAFHAGKTVKVQVDPPLSVAIPPKPAKPARPINPFPAIDPARGDSA